MSKLITTIIFIPDQDPNTGDIEVNHVNRILGNSIYFGDKFDMKVDSHLRRVINDIRLEIFEPYIETFNKDLPKGMDPYRVPNPKMIGNPFRLRSQIVIPVQIQLELPDEELTFDEREYNLLLPKGTVMCWDISKPRMCNYPKSYGTWRECKFGYKREFFEKLSRERIKFQKMRILIEENGDNFQDVKSSAQG